MTRTKTSNYFQNFEAKEKRLYFFCKELKNHREKRTIQNKHRYRELIANFEILHK